ncbi:ZIP family metal transporter [Sporosarcina limicola]|uniref:ZIP family zinc transporter n=1 Tax=Sporosarcina limicola TaxID=34101 RepID=A0A927R823_9BACL|nr:ZIP family metal transporter [Sporosarcina limicola]MBE1556574.1 ZIP family zinc transporter [Sporosarcina limicola]
MTPVWFVGFLSTFAGIGIGGIIAGLINGFQRSMGTIYAVSTGLILGLISFEIIPEAIQLGNWIIFLLGFLTGILVFKLIHMGIHKNSLITAGSYKPFNRRLGLFLALIISIHNLPMGVVMGTSGHSQFNLALLQALILHNIPEGMILFTPLFMARISFNKLFFLSILVAVPVALGALIGEVIGQQNTPIWAFLISLTVGTIYMVTIKEILTESIRHSSNRYSLLVAFLAFCLLGLYLIYF